MARLRRQEAAEIRYDDIGWEVYRHLVEKPARFPWARLRWEPVRIGPTWEKDGRYWRLPDWTLGWHVLGWCERWLEFAEGVSWRFTDEQARFVLWWYALDEDGTFLFRDGVLQRLKGWGKDPLAACLVMAEMVGPCRFADWDGDDPLATDVGNAWVQTIAVSQKQTKNTMLFLPGLVSREATRRYGIQIGKTIVHALGGRRQIEAITSSPASIEGPRCTFNLLGETHLWWSSNDGHDMADVLERNVTKSRGGAARTLRITNAYEPSEDSVAQHDREAWEKMQAGRARDVGLLYDSLEAPPEAPLAPDRKPRESDRAYEARVAKTINDVVAAIQGDSTWLDRKRIVESVLDIRNPPSRSRRFWYNQITAAEDAWVSQQELDAIADPSFEVSAGRQVTLGFDGSRADDHTALIGCDVASDHLFEIDIWAPGHGSWDPGRKPALGAEIDRRAVDRAVRAAFELYDVVGFYGDLKDWESYIDQWAQDFGDDLPVGATQKQPVAWDMRSREKAFTVACERLHAAVIESAAQATRGRPAERLTYERLTYDGAPRFRLHMLWARRAPNQWGVSIRKEHRESARKIDAATAAVLARLARQDYLALPAQRRRRKRGGRVW